MSIDDEDFNKSDEEYLAQRQLVKQEKKRVLENKEENNSDSNDDNDDTDADAVAGKYESSLLALPGAVRR